MRNQAAYQHLVRLYCFSYCWTALLPSPSLTHIEAPDSKVTVLFVVLPNNAWAYDRKGFDEQQHWCTAVADRERVTPFLEQSTRQRF